MQHSDPKKLSDELASMLSENQQLLNELDALMQDDLISETQSSFHQTDEDNITFQQSNEKPNLTVRVNDILDQTQDLNPTLDLTIQAQTNDKSHTENAIEQNNIKLFDIKEAESQVTNSNYAGLTQSHFESTHLFSKERQETDNHYKEQLTSSLSSDTLSLVPPTIDVNQLNRLDLTKDDSDNSLSLTHDSVVQTQSSIETTHVSHPSPDTEIIEKQPTVLFDQTWLTLSTLLAGIWILFWLNQNSINPYFQQKYHQSGPLELFENNPIWRAGGSLSDAMAQSMLDVSQPWIDRYIIKSESNAFNLLSTNEIDVADKNRVVLNSVLPLISATNDEMVKVNNAIDYDNLLANGLNSSTSELANQADTASTIHAELRKIEVLSPGDEQTAPRYGYLLKEGEKVFFAGDSLMQGVAPHVMNKLKKEFNISSINLSKQSTGLTYPKAFNWPAAIEKTLNENKDVGLLVMMLGANDPWDMQVKKGEPYLRFGTDPWDLEYQTRIDSIYRLAAAKGIGVIWISAPSMKKEKLNKGVLHLDTLYKVINDVYGGIFLESNIMFGYQADKYNAYATWNDKNSKIRSDDGVHFTPTGQKIIAEYVLSVIGVIKTAPKEETQAP